MRHLALSTAALLISVLSFSQAHAAAEVTLNSGVYLNSLDQKPVLKITADESGHSVQIEGPHVPATTLSANENHNFDTTDPLESGTVTSEFIRKCTAKPGREKPCDKSLYDLATGKLRLQVGDEYIVTARLLVLSSDSVLQAKWTTWTRDGVTVAQKMKKDVLKWSAPAKNNSGTPTLGGDQIKEPVAL